VSLSIITEISSFFALISFLVLIIRTINKVEAFFKDMQRVTTSSLVKLENTLTLFIESTNKRLESIEKLLDSK
jgi:uncharacterized protein YoxC